MRLTLFARNVDGAWGTCIDAGQCPLAERVHVTPSGSELSKEKKRGGACECSMPPGGQNLADKGLCPKMNRTVTEGAGPMRPLQWPARRRCPEHSRQRANQVVPRCTVA